MAIQIMIDDINRCVFVIESRFGKRQIGVSCPETDEEKAKRIANEEKEEANRIPMNERKIYYP